MNEGTVIQKEEFETVLTDVKKSLSFKEKPKLNHLISCCKNKKGPLPMKLRALPQSFWQQPNALADVSPTTYITPLDMEVPKVSKSEVVGVENIELLFSLFRCVEHIENTETNKKSLQGKRMKRGRPRSKKKNTVKSFSVIKQDSDPYFTAAVIPSIPIQDDQILAQGQQVLAMLSTTSKDKNLSDINSFSEWLSDFVINL